MKKLCLAVLSALYAVSPTALPTPAEACTGITLTAQDGAVVYGRTMEWTAFDMNSRLVITPRNYTFTAEMPDNHQGMTWTGQYGLVGLDAIGKDTIADGMNEKGLAVGAFWHPGFAEYAAFDPAHAANAIGPTNVCQYILSTCATVDEARTALAKVQVVAVFEPVMGMAPPMHFIITEPAGKSIVVEFHKGQMRIFDAPLRVITNSPTYDWHETNLRNYINLSPVALPAKKIEDMDFAPLGGGSGMIGLPGDFTPPSRFVRAVAFTQSARRTADGAETVYELLRILDNFNVPLGAAEGAGDEKQAGLRSATLWTTAHDTHNRVLHYHTMHNRRVRAVYLDKVDFSGKELLRQPLDHDKFQDIQDVTPGK